MQPSSPLVGGGLMRSLGGLFLSRPIIPQYVHTSREVLSYANGYNDEQVINSEIESGKAVYQLLAHHDYDEVDAVNVLMGDVFDMSTPDIKVLYMIAMLNELHVGDNGLNLMQELIKAKPKYDKGILSLRYLMKRKGLVLVKSSDDPRELVDEFNSDMAEDEFASKLAAAREKAPKAVEYLLRLIRRQEFGSEPNA